MVLVLFGKLTPTTETAFKTVTNSLTKNPTPERIILEGNLVCYTDENMRITRIVMETINNLEARTVLLSSVAAIAAAARCIVVASSVIALLLLLWLLCWSVPIVCCC